MMAEQKVLRSARQGRRWLWLFVMLLAPGAFAAGELYRYLDDSGQVVLDDHIPPEYAVRGYTVLSSNGRVIRTVPRQLTPDEIAARNAEQARMEELEREAARRMQADAELLRIYSSVADLERARDRKLGSIDTAISTTEANIQRLRIQKSNLESQAADIERSGGNVPPEIFENLRIIDIQIREKEQEIATRKGEQEQIREEFGQDLERFRELHAQAK